MLLNDNLDTILLQLSKLFKLVFIWMYSLKTFLFTFFHVKGTFIFKFKLAIILARALLQELDIVYSILGSWNLFCNSGVLDTEKMFISGVTTVVIVRLLLQKPNLSS